VATGGTISLMSCTLSGNYANSYYGGGGAIYVATGGTISLMSCTLSGNCAAYTYGGAIYVATGGTISLTSCTLSDNAASYFGGALYFEASSTGLLTNCSFDGTVSPRHNDIARADGTAKVTFACPDNLISNAVEMNGNEIAVIPPKELRCCTDGKCRNGITLLEGAGAALALVAVLVLLTFLMRKKRSRYPHTYDGSDDDDSKDVSLLLSA
jgi:hypothetical protein